MGVEPGVARAAVRVSLGRDTTQADVEGFLTTFARLVGELKQLTALAVEP
jgi:cysteine desulfurase